MKNASVVLVALALFALPAIVFGQTAQTAKVGFIDLQKVMLESEKGKQAKKVLTDEAEKLKKSLTQKQDELQKLKDALEKQSATITPEARAEKEKQYQAKLKDYQRVAADYQTELQQKDNEAAQKLLNELQDVVKRLGDTEKYTLILERSAAGILFGSPSADLTDRVIAMYNESVKKAPAAAAPAKK
jgi:outer membrane protein